MVLESCIVDCVLKLIAVTSFRTPHDIARKPRPHTTRESVILLARQIQVSRLKAPRSVLTYPIHHQLATCGGGGISPTFGAALWVIDFSLQAALVGVERLYFHQGMAITYSRSVSMSAGIVGTISNCAYCWWGQCVYPDSQTKIITLRPRKETPWMAPITELRFSPRL